MDRRSRVTTNDRRPATNSPTRHDTFDHIRVGGREALYETGAPRAMLPFLPAYIEETQRVFGGDPWVYGIEANRRTLEAQPNLARLIEICGRA